MPITVKRVYDPPSSSDGLRVLADRLWPRGLSKAAAGIDLWAQELAPSNGLRKWYAHEAKKWSEFKRRYFSELKTRTEALNSLRRGTSKRNITLLFASKEPRLNNAFALKQFLESRARPRRARAVTRSSRAGGKRR